MWNNTKNHIYHSPLNAKELEQSETWVQEEKTYKDLFFQFWELSESAAAVAKLQKSLTVFVLWQVWSDSIEIASLKHSNYVENIRKSRSMEIAAIKRSTYAQKHPIKPAIPQRSNAAMFCYIFQCFCCSNLAFKARNYLSYIKIIYSSNAFDLTKNLRQKLVKLETHPNSLFN